VLDEGSNPLVVDWRAPAAEPFYRATPTDPHGLVRRRHLYRGRRGPTKAGGGIAIPDDDAMGKRRCEGRS
jgi:hypothetical protein